MHPPFFLPFLFECRHGEIISHIPGKLVKADALVIIASTVSSQDNAHVGSCDIPVMKRTLVLEFIDFLTNLHYIIFWFRKRYTFLYTPDASGIKAKLLLLIAFYMCTALVGRN